MDNFDLLGPLPEARSTTVLEASAGGRTADMDLDAFLVQAREYEDRGGALDTIYKILNTLAITHPFATLRAAELQRWIEAGQYDRIVKGEYARRGAEQDQRPLADDLSEAAAHYAREAKKTVDGVTDALGTTLRAQFVKDRFLTPVNGAEPARQNSPPGRR